MYEENGLRVTATVNKKIVNFLDVTLDLIIVTHRLYWKPNANLLHISSLSNHPPFILKNIPLEVGDFEGFPAQEKTSCRWSLNLTWRRWTRLDTSTSYITRSVTPLLQPQLPAAGQGPGERPGLPPFLPVDFHQRWPKAPPSQQLLFPT